MTIEKLAILIVAEYFEGSPGDERAQVAIEREIKNLKANSRRKDDGTLFVELELEG